VSKRAEQKKARTRGSSASGSRAEPRASTTKKPRGAGWLGKLAVLRDPWLWPPLGLWALGLLEPYVWLGALTAELSLQLGLASLLAAVAALLFRRWLRAGAWLSGALLLLAPSWALVRPARRTPEQGPLLRVAQAHLDRARLGRRELLAWLQRNPLEVLSLTGVASESLAELSRPIDGFSVAARPRSARALLLVSSQLLPRPPAAASATLRIGRCELELTQIQLPRLSARSELSTRERQLRVLTAADKKRRSLYIGHLGSRSGAHDLQAWLAAHGLRDARLAQGLLATAPAALGDLGLPLDHVLVHGWIGVRSAATGDPLVAGAHRTLRATLELTEPRCR
jgi:hypothetical protein